MSWARIDDEAWFHEKFEELQAEGVDGMAAIGLWAMAVSFTGQKKSAKLTLAEAAMLCGGDNNLASRCFVLLHSACLADLPLCFRSLEDSLASKTPSILIHDWEKYRSKDEAKAAAGRKGGKKSAEIRRSKSKQNPSTGEANDKQGASTPPTPDPDPDPDPDPVPDPSLGSEMTSDSPKLSLEKISHKGFKRFGMLGGANVARVGRLCPVAQWEWDAVLATKGKSWGYAAKVLESIREESSKPDMPAAAGVSMDEKKRSDFYAEVDRLKAMSQEIPDE